MPASIELAEEYPEELSVVLVESQQHPRSEWLRMAYMREWAGRGAMWTDEWIGDFGASRLPRAALLSRTGRVLFIGHPITEHEQLERALEVGLAAVGDPGGDLSPALRKAVRSFEQGKWSRALEAIEGLRAARQDPDSAQVRALLLERISRRIARGSRLLEERRFTLAAEQSRLLKRRLRGDGVPQEYRDRVDAWDATLEADGIEEELAADRELEALQARMRAAGPDDQAEELREFLERRAGTFAARRAEDLLALVRAGESP